LIAAARQTLDGREIKILVGGYPFNVAPDLWQELGADGQANDAGEAVGLANRMLGAQT
jgi:methanogenic corrinoid protein MtbC1